MTALATPWVRVPLVLVAAVVLQTTLVAELRLFGVNGDLLLLLAVAAGLVGPPQRAAVVGFASGLGLDLVVETPFGLSALAGCLTAYVVASIQTVVLRATWWIPMLTAAAATALGIGIYALGGYVLGERQLLSGELARIILVQAAVNAVLIRPAVWVQRWAMAGADLAAARR
ncbi:MAG: rod shape-determining protein MreD [Acidimicrobiales bacterium]|nr:rod shape-determining protein MreD [Acidimicrobiales bacterium]